MNKKGAHTFVLLLIAAVFIVALFALTLTFTGEVVENSCAEGTCKDYLFCQDGIYVENCFECGCNEGFECVEQKGNWTCVELEE